MIKTPVPNSKEIRDVIEGMLGRTTDIENDYSHIDPGADLGASVAVYVDALNRTMAVVVADFHFTAYAGAALALMPPAGAQDVVNSGGPCPDSYLENMYELLNVMSSIFNKDDAPHLRIHLMYTPGEILPPDLADAVKTYGNRIDVTANIEGYGQGRLAIIVL